MSVEFCRCKSHCAQEQGDEAPSGFCEVAYANSGKLPPKDLAEYLFLKMTPIERATAYRQGAANMEARVKTEYPDWGYRAVEDCLDEIAWLCTPEEE